MEDVRHVRHPRAPPPMATRPLPPTEVWPRLATPQQQAVVRLLSELIQRQLLPPAGKEVADEPR
jgi:hypothetical protein